LHKKPGEFTKESCRSESMSLNPDFRENKPKNPFEENVKRDKEDSGLKNSSEITNGARNYQEEWSSNDKPEGFMPQTPVVEVGISK